VEKAENARFAVELKLRTKHVREDITFGRDCWAKQENMITRLLGKNAINGTRII
jgi:acetyltransferase-like isoleucine patch superfamily enzyme